MEAVKERIVKFILRLLGSTRLPIWSHSWVILAGLLVIWGKLVFLRFNDLERWEARGITATHHALLASSFILVVWLVVAFSYYCEYRQFPAYLKLVSTSRLTGRILWRVVISSVIVLVVLGVVFSVGT